VVVSEEERESFDLFLPHRLQLVGIDAERFENRRRDLLV
jgi:hypothetical protein